MDENGDQCMQDQRSIWRDKKRQQRKSLTPEQRDRQNAKRRLSYACENQSDVIGTPESQPQTPSSEGPVVVTNTPNTLGVRRAMADITNRAHNVTTGYERREMQPIDELRLLDTRANLENRFFSVGESSATTVTIPDPTSNSSGMPNRFFCVGESSTTNARIPYPTSDDGELPRFVEAKNEIRMPGILFNVGESRAIDTNNISNPISDDIRVWKVGRTGYRNCARNYQESQGVPIFSLPPMKTCPHCQARLFHCESPELCCLSGKVNLPDFPLSSDMLDLYSDQWEYGAHFRQNIRKYNHVFSFTSMGVHLDDELANARQGVYTFRAQGSIYHRIGGFLPLNEGDRPRFLQLYIYDTEHENENRAAENSSLRLDVIDRIKNILNAHNPFVHNLRHLTQRSDLSDYKFVIKEQPINKHQYSMPTASQVAAVVVGGDDISNLKDRDIMVESVTGQLSYIKDTAGYYDPLQYPLLFPYGSYGWDLNSRSSTGKKLTCREFYAYMFQMRQHLDSLILRGGRLLQQFVVDNCVKMQANNLRWIALNQDKIRADLYKGLEDSLHDGEHNTENVGRRTILPSSFVGSPRDMHQRYQDAMALVHKFGKPDIFLTMTCNPSWPEIQSELLAEQVPNDRPDLLTRVFHAKLEELKKDVLERGVLRTVVAYVYVIEFQKRGLPHVHMLLILDQNDKLTTPDDFDKIVRAVIPDEQQEPKLYKAVLKHMIHGPCGVLNHKSPCMKQGSCKKGFPKEFSNDTKQGNDSYPLYRRPQDRPAVPLRENSRVRVDNRWVVPYNPFLLLKYDCHINIEICSSIKCVKYLYKYIHKGSDRVSREVHNGDEIAQYVDARWICTPEAMWKLYKFPMTRICPAVDRLQVHLPNMHQVRFDGNQQISSVLANPRNSKTMLTEFFKMNSVDPNARKYLYREFPEHYRWLTSSREWQKRKSTQRVMGRLYVASPLEGERIYLRMLLNHVRERTSFEHLRMINGVTHPTSRAAAEALGLIENDESIRQCLLEACSVRMPSALRRLFATILVYCQPTGLRALWDEFFPYMVEDYPASNTTSNFVFLTNKLLQDIDRLLRPLRKRISDYTELPSLPECTDDIDEFPSIMEEYFSVPIPDEDLACVGTLNSDQQVAYDTIMNDVISKAGCSFFVDGPGGTGKTFLYRALLATVKSRGEIAIPTATSGIAATLLHQGRTSHSTFQLPLNPDSSSTCSFTKRSKTAILLKNSAIIVWDEAPMTHRYQFEAADRSLKDLMGNDLPFGGKIIVFGGDLRQVLPVVRNGTRAQMIDASFVRSSMWRHIRILRLRENMRSIDDKGFANFLLSVGNGNEPTISDQMIRLPTAMIIPTVADSSIEALIDQIFPSLSEHVGDGNFIVERAIITPLNEDADRINNKVVEKFLGEGKTYYSFDSVPEDRRNLYQQEFLNSFSASGLPPHALTLKPGVPLMLLRNIDPKHGLCNGTRLLCHSLKDNFIDAEILTGHSRGNRVMTEYHYPTFEHLYPSGVQRYDVRARLIRNYDIFNYNHKGKTKQTWKMLFVDVEGEGIQCNIFGPAIEKFVGRCQEGFIYILLAVQVIFAEGKNKIVPNWKQMIIKEETNVIREEEDDISIPSFHYNLVQLNRLSCHIDCTDRVYDAMGLALYVSPVENIGVDSVKRDVAIMDTTWTVIKLTLWNDFVHVLDENLNHVDICPIIVACGLHVKSFYGTSSKLNYIVNAVFVQYCRVAAYACHVDSVDNIIYEACNRCLKKVVIFQGLQKCQSCNLTNTVTIPRLLLRLTIFDKSGNLKVTILHDLAQHLLGCLATEIKSVLQQPNGRNRVMEKVFACFRNKAFSWVLHPPIEAFNPEHSYTVGYVLHIDWAEECMWLNKYIASKKRK
ncbi:uncharacterized protein [Spinacia oleracea]|uniref:ATP-dependent DNA helicase n=1 Tax=Spinacia oleracea TaxID=3562 RepID=A0ABM3QQB8_SPIOL|nr:uncharacterized protein LOC130461470 [Spinacia oleracea]